MNPVPSEYGPFADIVSVAGALLSVVAAISLSWRGRAKWEPSEQDVPKGAQKVGGLVTAVAIAAIWFWLRHPTYSELITLLAIIFVLCCVGFLLVYGVFIEVLTYEQIYVTSPNKTASRKIIGGFWLTPSAKAAIRKHAITVQEVLKGAAYDPDKVWPRLSRAFAKLVFVVCYLGLTSSGTIALTCASILISAYVQSEP